MDRLGERRIHQRGAHDLQELGALLLGDIARSHLGLDEADEAGQGQALDDEGTRGDEQGDREQQRTHRGVRRDSLRGGQGDRASHARPHDDAALARPQRLIREVVQVRSAHRVAARAPLEAATIVVKRILPVLGAQVASLKHVGVNLARLVHALLEALDACDLGLVAALTVGTAVVQPGEHDGDEDGSHHHDERAEDDGEERGEGQAAGERGGLLDDAEGLQAHRQEDATLQDERHGLPVLLGETPVRRGDNGRASARDDQSGDDGRNEAGPSQVLGGDRCDEGHREGENRVGRGLLDEGTQTHADLADDPANSRSDTEGDGHLADEQARIEGVFVGGQAGTHRGGEHNQRGCVVEEPLAFEDRDDAVGDTRAFRDRDGDRVGRRQDRAQRDTPGQGDRGDQPVDDEADREGGQEHEGNRKHRDGLHLAPEVHGRHTHGRREQQGRQHHLEDDVRLNLDGPHLRQEPDDQANDQQDQGGCHAHLRGDELACHDDEHSGHGDKKGFHRSIVSRATPPAPLPSHYSGYARRELARRTTPRPHGLDTIPECQTDPHDQSTLYNRRIVSRRFS